MWQGTSASFGFVEGVWRLGDLGFRARRREGSRVRVRLLWGPMGPPHYDWGSLGPQRCREGSRVTSGKGFPGWKGHAGARRDVASDSQGWLRLLGKNSWGPRAPGLTAGTRVLPLLTEGFEEDNGTPPPSIANFSFRFSCLIVFFC